MAQPEKIEFTLLLYTGIVMMLLLSIAVVLFVIIHQRKVYGLQVRLREQELAYQSTMLRAVVASQEGERERIARDLHDEIGASLSAARLFVNQIHCEVTAPHLQEMTQQANQILGNTLQSVRLIVQNLSPAVLEKFGFGRALAVLASRLEATGLSVTLQVDEVVEQLEAGTQLALYRIVQELFANASKHAHAQQVTLHLDATPAMLHLTVSDDGRGFTPGAAVTASSIGLGLTGIQARVRLLGGQLELTSVPDGGTRVELLVPR